MGFEDWHGMGGMVGAGAKRRKCFGEEQFWSDWEGWDFTSCVHADLSMGIRERLERIRF